jgi:hypothetical protein
MRVNVLQKQKLESKRFAEEERRAVSSIAEAKRL